MAEKRTTSDINKALDDILSANKKLRAFVKWYCNGQSEEEYEKIKNSYCSGLDMQSALNQYLERDDVKEGIAYVIRANKELDLIKIYNKMLTNALNGDVNCANWIMKFGESKFFDNSKNEIDKIIDGLDLDE